MAEKQIRVFVVEDDAHLRRDLVDFLTLRGFAASGCESVEAFLRVDQDVEPELVVLDIGLPGRDGLSLVTELRQRASSPAIVLLTAFGADEDYLRGLACGADAYVVKNRSLAVVEATCRSVLRRFDRDHRDPTRATWALDEGASKLQVPGGACVALTHQEALFLQRALRDAGRVVTRDLLLGDLGKANTLANLRNLDNFAARLRRKVLAQTGVELPLRSAYGEGYVFRGDVCPSSPPPPSAGSREL